MQEFFGRTRHVSFDLWNEAYEKLRGDDKTKDLVEKYEKIPNNSMVKSSFQEFDFTPCQKPLTLPQTPLG